MKFRSVLLLLLIVINTTAFSQDAKRSASFNLEEGIAIQGYDPVAYFVDGKAIKGKKETGVVSYGGVKYRFSSVGNKEMFLKNPSIYEPRYGGWCAYAMGKYGKKVEVDPETFKIADGKLFLFYNKFFNNTLKLWNKDEANLLRNADLNWQKIFH